MAEKTASTEAPAKKPGLIKRVFLGIGAAWTAAVAAEKENGLDDTPPADDSSLFCKFKNACVGKTTGEHIATGVTMGGGFLALWGFATGDVADVIEGGCLAGTGIVIRLGLVLYRLSVKEGKAKVEKVVDSPTGKSEDEMVEGAYPSGELFEPGSPEHLRHVATTRAGISKSKWGKIEKAAAKSGGFDQLTGQYAELVAIVRNMAKEEAVTVEG